MNAVSEDKEDGVDKEEKGEIASHTSHTPSQSSYSLLSYQLGIYLCKAVLDDRSKYLRIDNNKMSGLMAVSRSI
ncbi:MAG: hypothetical protein AB4206_09860 [Xenococcaceae cyanobacterium]